MALKNWSPSKSALLFVAMVILGTHFFYYPKWEKKGTEATLSWDVSGYYMYLPAIFIHKDLKQCGFLDKVLKEYHPTPNPQQVIKHKESGNYVMKYSIGQAVQYAPFFFVAHAWASSSKDYPADGFSFPYQLLISLGSIFMALLGLYYLRRILLFYFEERALALTLVGLVLGSNYLNYSAIDGAMTHNYLFTIYAILVYNTIVFYRRPTLKLGALIGALIGLAALTRPTEILAFIVPVLWGFKFWNLESITTRLAFFKTHATKIILAVGCCILVGSVQLIYWKYATGDWIVYSYEDQGFSWLWPHIFDGLFSYRSGWLTYSPFMVCSLIGFYFLFKSKKAVFTACFIFALLFMYVTFAWDIWWYGGSIGQRSMVQIYPVLAYPIASFFTWVLDRTIVTKIMLAVLVLLSWFLSLNFMHHAHHGGSLKVGQMTGPYYWKTVGRLKADRLDQKLLDTDEMYEGSNNNWSLIYSESDSTYVLDAQNQFANLASLSLPAEAEWVRVSADFKQNNMEWSHWSMTQFNVKVKSENQVVKQRMIRVQRHLDPHQSANVFIDLRLPKVFDQVEIFCWNASSNKKMIISKVQVKTLEK